MQVDPDNRLVAGSLETEWNNKLRAFAQARDEAERQRDADRATLDKATEARIRELAHDFPAVWDDTATSHRDRKRMARLLLEDVTLLKADRLHVHIRFKGRDQRRGSRFSGPAAKGMAADFPTKGVAADFRVQR